MIMEKIYMDSAATSYPKPECVTRAVMEYMTGVGSNINRGAYEDAYSAAAVVYETREKLCKLFDFDLCNHVIFTANVTYALNFILKGYLKAGDHVLVSSMEHNAVMRPLVQLEKEGVTFSRIPATKEGELCLEEMESLLKSETKAVVLSAASNVCGTCNPLKEVGAFCKKHNLTFIVDSAQVAGVFPISMKEMQIDVLAFTGHKSLLAPQGIGGFLVREEIAKEIEPLITGGTGSASDSEETPEFLPDKFEAGTMNLPAIYGLHASLSYLEEIGLERIAKRELKLLEQLLEGLKNIHGIHLIGRKDIKNRAAVVSIQCDWLDEAALAFQLNSGYGIMTRVGMHCAPNAHKTLGTFPRGTIRFSIGYDTKESEIEAVLQALRILKNQYDIEN